LSLSSLPFNLATIGEIILLILVFFEGVDWVLNSKCSPLDNNVLMATSLLSATKGEDANRSDSNGQEESIGEAVDDSAKKLLAIGVETSPAVEQGSVGSPDTVDPLAAAVSMTMGMFGGVSNVVDDSFRRRRLWDDDVEVEAVITLPPYNNER
jgi:hypothetical protein